MKKNMIGNITMLFVVLLVIVKAPSASAHMMMCSKTRTADAAERCPSLMANTAEDCHCYHFCGERLLTCDANDLFHLRCDDKLVMGCTPSDRPDVLGDSNAGDGSADPSSAGDHNMDGETEPSFEVDSLLNGNVTDSTVSDETGGSSNSSEPHTESNFQEDSTGSDSNSNIWKCSAIRSANAANRCPSLVAQTTEDCQCYHFCGARLLSCDVGDLFHMNCQEELVMGCTPNDRPSAAQNAPGTTNTNAANPGLRTSSISHEILANSGSYGSATFTVVGVQVVVLALFA